MTVSLKHKFNQSIPDGPDTTLVRPSNWNDEHDLLLAASVLLGRYAGTPGAAQEIAIGLGLKFTSNVLDLSSTGEVCYFAMSTPPAGFLKANGAAISRTTYATLFALLSTTYGAGDGSTTFNLPDLRGEFVRGWDDGRGVDSSRAIGTAQAAAFASHAHSISDPGHNHSHGDPGHAHSISDPGHAHGASQLFSLAGSGYNRGTGGSQMGNVGATDGAGTGIGIYAAGTGVYNVASGTGVSVVANGGTETRPRNVSLLACIRY